MDNILTWVDFQGKDFRYFYCFFFLIICGMVYMTLGNFKKLFFKFFLYK